MRNWARPSALLVTLGWIAFWGVAFFLLWNPEYQATLDIPNFTAVADITASGFKLLIATFVSLIAIVLALPVLAATFLPQEGPLIEQPLLRAGAPSQVRPTERLRADQGDEMAALRSRLERQEEEIQRLRQVISTHLEQHSAPTEEQRPAA